MSTHKEIISYYVAYQFELKEWLNRYKKLGIVENFYRFTDTDFAKVEQEYQQIANYIRHLSQNYKSL